MNFWLKHRRTILTVLTCVGAVTTAYLGYKGGLKAQELLESKFFRENGPSVGMPDNIFKYYGPKEVITATWSAWGPAVGACLVTISCCVGLNIVDANTISDISSVANVAQLTANTLRNNIRERLSDEEFKEIDQKTTAEVAKKTIDMDKKSVMALPSSINDGEQTYVLADNPNIIFRMNPVDLQSEINDLNAQIVSGQGPDIEEAKCGAYLPYNALLERVGVKPIGDGWNRGWPCVEYSRSPFIISPDYTGGVFDNGASYSIIGFENGPFYLDDPHVWKYV